MTWTRTRLKYLAAVPITNGVGEPAEFDDPAWPRYIRTTDIAGPTVLRNTTFASLPPATAALAPVARGDILMSAAGTIGRTYLHLTNLPACYAGYLVRFRPSQRVDPRFISYWTQSRPFLDQVEVGAVRSTIDNFSAGKYQNLSICLPGLTGQQAIADYLDAETARIDGVARAREQQLALLEEHFESVVWDAVTGAGQLNTGGRESGLDWVRAIPRHWGTPRVGARFQVQLGKMLNPEAASGDERYSYLRNVNVQWDRIDTADLEEMEFDATDRLRYALRDGDLLVCEGGEVGRAAVWHDDVPACYYQKAVHRVRPYGADSPRFLMYLLRAAAGRGVFRNEGNTSTIVHLTAEKLRAHRFPWPPPGEQRRIVDEVDREHERVQRLRRSLLAQIDLLLERRQALITAAVTGQLEIPGVAA